MNNYSKYLFPQRSIVSNLKLVCMEKGFVISTVNAHKEDICETNDDWTISLMQLSIKLERNWRLSAKFVKLLLANGTKICWKFVESVTQDGGTNLSIQLTEDCTLYPCTFDASSSIKISALPLIRDESIHDFRLELDYFPLPRIIPTLDRPCASMSALENIISPSDSPVILIAKNITLSTSHRHPNNKHEIF